MTTMLVHYVGNAHSRFDREYYVAHHLPLVHQTWEPHGLRETEAFFEADGDEADGVIAICLCHFADRDSLARALSDPGTAAVMDDVANFTDITPMRTVMDRAPESTSRA